MDAEIAKASSVKQNSQSPEAVVQLGMQGEQLVDQ
jgi:hypothetical protein